MDNQAFVVMQVGVEGSTERKRANEIYEYIIQPALKEYELTSYRADLDLTPGAITPKLLSELLNSKVIIADLTGNNPNVFYELGITHSFAMPLICIAGSVPSLPFDAKDERVIELGENSDGLSYANGEKAKKQLIASLEIVLAEGYDPPSPVKTLAANRSLDDLAPNNPVAAELGEIRSALADLQERVKPRTVVPVGIRAEIEALRAVLMRNVAFLDSDDMAMLMVDGTSRGHDSWVERLKEAVDGRQHNQPSVGNSYEEEPF
jgi:hypothetical protein